MKMDPVSFLVIPTMVTITPTQRPALLVIRTVNLAMVLNTTNVLIVMMALN
jgi:hypothetical protein